MDPILLAIPGIYEFVVKYNLSDLTALNFNENKIPISYKMTKRLQYYCFAGPIILEKGIGFLSA